MGPSEDTRFHWGETAELLASCLASRELVVAAKGNCFVSNEIVGVQKICFKPPLVLPAVVSSASASDYLDQLPTAIGTQLLVLMQAGAAALGVYVEDECKRHKVIRKYVVRGKGKAQASYLKTRGKSRYGSRLRLQNARRFFCEVSEKLVEWQEQFGRFDRIFYSCPVRLWSDYFQARMPPPFERSDERLLKIPLDLRVPSFREVERAFWQISHGCLQRVD